MKRRIALLGSTGSMGVQALEVIEQQADILEVEVLAAHSHADLLIAQAKKFVPNAVIIVNETYYEKVKSALEPDDIKVFTGENSLCDIVEMDSVDMILSCIVGIAGLKPVVRAIEHGKPIALANKETLVVAGELITRMAKKEKTAILPVDSEHSAIFQSLVGEMQNPIEKLILTASGGPFLGKKNDFLEKITKEQALQHPTWNMGKKITIDSATMMNKGLEVIEARWFFDVPCDRIEVVIHPQSIIHSLVQFSDGSIKAQMGLPDMKLPIQYALTFPRRVPSTARRFSFDDYTNLSFCRPDLQSFPCLALAYAACNEGGDRPCVLNAANEIAVAHFLNDKILFTDIPKYIEKALSLIPFSKPESISDYLEIDEEVRKIFNHNS